MQMMMSGDVFSSIPSSIKGFAQEPDSNPNPKQSNTKVVKKRRNLPGTPDPDAEVIALSPKSLMATNRFICEICNKGFQRDQNLQLHRRGHNLPWKLRQRTNKEVRKKVYICPEKTCVHHDPSRALGDLTGVKKHFSRKHGEKKWKCEKCSKKYAVQSDWKAHSKTCGTREYKCDCGTLFSRKDSFITHRAFCDALAEESARLTSNITATNMNFRNEPLNEGVNNAAQSNLEHRISGAAGISQFGTGLGPNYGGVAAGNSSIVEQQKPKFSQWLDQVNSNLYVSSGSTNTLPDLVQMAPGNPFGSLSMENFGSCNQSQWVDKNVATSKAANLSLSAGVNKGSNMAETMNSLYSNSQNHQSSSSASMSATALLQKAAQMGSTSSNSSFFDGRPGDPAELFERVSQSIKVKRYSEALDDLNSAIEADPTLSEAYWHRASILRQLCRYEDSEKNYKKFLEMKPKNSAAEKELSQLLQAQSALETAISLFDSGDFTKSLDYIDKVVLVFSPACSRAKLLKVKLLLATKDYSSAISEAGYILKEDENNLQALLLRGRAYYYLADHDVASRHFQKGLRLDPEHSELKKAYFGLKNLLKKTKSAEDNINKGKLRLAVEDYKAALALDPNHLAHNVHLHLGLCNVLVKLGRGKDAVSSCTEALNIDGELLEALVQRGEAKLLIEDWEGAVADLKSAAEKSPQDMNIREALLKAERSLKLSQRKDWYKILGVSKTSSVSEIKRAYKKLALQWHPDKNVDNREEAEAKFQEIAAAYEVLGDEEKRARFDRGEDIEDMGMGGGGGGFNPFGGGGQQFTFHFEGGFPGGGFGGFQF